MANTALIEQVQALLPPTQLKELSTLWFQHIVDEQDLVVPSQDTMMQWFRKDETFDRLCSAKFRPSLEQIRSLGVTGDTILHAVQPSTPLEWIQLIILFDQIPRNIFRGEESKVAFTEFDPVAQHIAQAAVAADMHRHPLARYRIGHRLWITMPFMHSEDRTMHQEAVELVQGMVDDIRNTANIQQDMEDDAGNHRQELIKCKAIISSNIDAALDLCDRQLQFEIKHKVIIDKFGRYPHRNKPLGRQMTTDEQQFLDEGGDTFGS